MNWRMLSGASGAGGKIPTIVGIFWIWNYFIMSSEGEVTDMKTNSSFKI
jgi:hypothetical protein